MKNLKNFIDENLETKDKKFIDKCIDQFNTILTDDPDNIDEFLYYFLDELTGGGSDEIIIDHIENWLKDTKKGSN